MATSKPKEEKKEVGSTKASETSTTELQYTQDELREMGEILLKAQEIQSDGKLYKLVRSAMDDKVKKIQSLDDLRRKAKEVEMRDNQMEDAYASDEK